MKGVTLIFCLSLASSALAQSSARAAIERYNREELALATVEPVAPAQLVAHWRRLTAIRAQLARLPSPARWPMGERVVLRHELARLLGQLLVVDVAEGTGARAVAAAAGRRRRDLNAIARWSNRNLEFALDPSFALALSDFRDR